MKVNSYKTKTWISNLNFHADKALKGNVATRVLSSLHGGSFEITLTVPLSRRCGEDSLFGGVLT